QSVSRSRRQDVSFLPAREPVFSVLANTNAAVMALYEASTIWRCWFGGKVWNSRTCKESPYDGSERKNAEIARANFKLRIAAPFCLTLELSGGVAVRLERNVRPHATRPKGRGHTRPPFALAREELASREQELGTGLGMVRAQQDDEHPAIERTQDRQATRHPICTNRMFHFGEDDEGH